MCINKQTHRERGIKRERERGERNSFQIELRSIRNGSLPRKNDLSNWTSVDSDRKFTEKAARQVLWRCRHRQRWCAPSESGATLKDPGSDRPSCPQMMGHLPTNIHQILRSAAMESKGKNALAILIALGKLWFLRSELWLKNVLHTDNKHALSSHLCAQYLLWIKLSQKITLFKHD